MRWLFSILVCFVIFLSLSFPTHAQATTYTVDYNFVFTPDSKENLDVVLNVHLKNLRSDLYINEFSLTFPSNFISGPIIARDSNGPIDFVRSEIATGMKVTFKFGEPSAQKAEHFITISYKLDDLFSEQGFVTEAILPLIQPDESSKVNVELNLPPTFNETLSISKPIPSQIDGTRIVWNDVQVRTIYTVFGTSQIYNTKLTYNLKNSTVFSRVERIVLPPDTLYQRMYINSLSTEPDKVFTDDDGNVIAEYSLEPRESMKIDLNATIEVFAKPQEEMREVVKSRFEHQKKYLLTAHPLWQIDAFTNDKRLDVIKDVKGVYSFVVDELSYSFEKVEKGNKRIGAQEVLKRPSVAVCTEFTDLFIALSREKGIYAREIQGYGYSNKQNIRPLSLVTDILHAWPEFYEPAQNIWMQVDPTWEDTSGIDYFTGLDVNHIAFVIHGKSPTSPLPVGFYKTGISRDIDVSVATKRPENKPRLSVSADIPKSITTHEFQEAIIHVKNTGNSSFYNLRLNSTSKYITVEGGIIEVGFLAPYESKDIQVKLKARINSPKVDELLIEYDGIKLFSKNVLIDNKGKTNGLMYIFAGVGIMGLLLGSLFLRTKH